ncbi:hypothetical protein NW768_010118 [Fusarium equiseti]|uniref:2EXR domain-containing protein n=1 Tax=Fusarium equiseti TaxID=61235 RepID=A0ABQ8R142_FUSEQ|nr:hypothetical protein NW768_010118 [Fusarium equiseti]
MSSKTQTIQFSSLTQEIRDHIWALTLPSHRIFHLDKSHDGEQHAGAYTLQNTYQLPPALQICHESRKTALRQGFFFTPPHSNKSVYFIPETDILYFGRVECQRLKEKEHIDMPDSDKVLNVGFEWASFFEYDPDQSIVPARRYWRRVVECLYVQMPHLKTLNHISPVPVGKPQCEYRLTPLPGDTTVLWQGTNEEGKNGGAFVAAQWRDVTSFIEKTLEESERSPEILGWKLHASSNDSEDFSFNFEAFLRS